MSRRSLLRALLLTPLFLIGLYCIAPETAAQEELENPIAAPVVAEHRLLQGEVGTWDVVLTVQGTEARGVERNRMLGELWLLSEFEGELLGGEFLGHGSTGFDAGTGKFVAHWIDNTRHRMTLMEGSLSEDGTTRTMTWLEPTEGGGFVRMFGKHERIDADSRRYEQLMEGSDEPQMVARYTRRP